MGVWKVESPKSVGVLVGVVGSPLGWLKLKVKKGSISIIVDDQAEGRLEGNWRQSEASKSISVQNNSDHHPRK